MHKTADLSPSHWAAGARPYCLLIGAVFLIGAVSAIAQEEPGAQPVTGGGDWLVTQPSLGVVDAVPTLELMSEATPAPAELASSDAALSTIDLANARWQFQGSFVGGETIEGGITMTSGSTAVLQAGRLTGKVKGATVWGDITGDSGEFFGTFEGVVGPSGLRGTFTGRSDERGSWTWEGPLPRPVLAQP